MQPVIDSLPDEWEIIIYDNGANAVWIVDRADGVPDVPDVSVYGRYAAIEYASHDLIWTQDDDVIVSDPQGMINEWIATSRCEICDVEGAGLLIANMPQEFRHDGYTDSCLVGFGACFHRNLSEMCFNKFGESDAISETDADLPDGFFYRTCDVVFTTLASARVLVDVAKTNREFASDSDRMWKQPGHVGERQLMLDLARRVRDAE